MRPRNQHRRDSDFCSGCPQAALDVSYTHPCSGPQEQSHAAFLDQLSVSLSGKFSFGGGESSTSHCLCICLHYSFFLYSLPNLGCFRFPWFDFFFFYLCPTLAKSNYLFYTSPSLFMLFLLHRSPFFL